MENPVYNPDPEEFDHVDDFIDDSTDTDDIDQADEDEQEKDGCEHGGCMPGPEEFD